MISRRLQAVQSPIIPVIGEMIRANPGTVSLGQGVVHWHPPREALDAAAHFGKGPRDHLYGPVGGITPLLDALEQKLWNDNHIKVAPASRLVVTAGANMAFVNALLAIADPGDEIILNTPYYFNHEMAITIAGCKPVCVPTSAAHQLDLDALRDAINDQTRAIVTISPNNPTGAVYPEEALYEVNQLCRDAGIYHISDEAYEYFTFDGATHFSPGSIAEAADYTISIFSLSKSHGFASWRIGYMAVPEELLNPIKKIQDTLLICPPVVSQQAALGALSAGTAWVRKQVASLAASRKLVAGALRDLDEFIEAPPSSGALYFYPKLLTGIPALAIAEQLIRQYKIAVIPGETFGSPTPCLRIGYGALPPDALRDALGRLTTGLRELLS